MMVSLKRYQPPPHATSHEDTGSDEIDVASLSGLLADDQHVLDSEAQAAVKYQADVALAGVAPTAGEFDAWAVGDRGMAIGTGGRVFFVYKDGSGPTTIKYVELS